MTRWPPPPTLGPDFYKAHGLGNDYLVFQAGDGWPATPGNVRRVCDRHRGVGSDGIVAVVAGPRAEEGEPARRVEVALRMFNPDGGEFERSGNGLRVLASWLLRRHPGLEEIDAVVGGTRVRMRVHGKDGPRHDVSVEMGRARLGPAAVALDPAALDDEGRLTGPDGTFLEVVPVAVGNPHVVVLCREASELTEARLASLGPFVSEHPDIEHGTNVQLALVAGPGTARALIWERGVGRTSASGTSACAVAVALVSSGALEAGEIAVEMPGGVLRVTVSEERDVVLRGPVEEVVEGRLTDDMVAGLARGPQGPTSGP